LPTAGARPTVGVSPASAEGSFLSIEENENRNVAEARHAVTRQAGVWHLTRLELDGLEERASNSHDQAPLHRVLQVIGVIAPHSKAASYFTGIDLAVGGAVTPA
jgi:hypothetical protein